MRVLRHIVDFIKDNKLHPVIEEGFRVHETTDLIADDVDASLVRCVQMDNQVFVPILQFGLVRIYQIDDGSRFACAWWTIEE